MARGRHARSRRFGVVAVVATAASLTLLVAGGAAFGAYRYESARTAEILPGVRIAGVDVGGMTRREAARAVRAVVDEELAEPLAITVGDHKVRVSPGELGRRAAVGAAVQEALELNATLSTFDRFWHRVNEESLGVEIDVEYRTGGRAVDQLAAELADEVFEPWTNASIGITNDANDVVFHRSSPGRQLPRDEAPAANRSGLGSGGRRGERDPQRTREVVAQL